MDNTMQYTAPKARRLRRLAAQEAFQDENGKPDVAALAAAVGIHRKAARHIIDDDAKQAKAAAAAAAPKAKGKSADLLS